MNEEEKNFCKNDKYSFVIGTNNIYGIHIFCKRVALADKTMHKQMTFKRVHFLILNKL